MDGFVHVLMSDELRTYLNAIFTKEFIQKNTNFCDFKGFQYSSAVIVNWETEHMVYDQSLLDNFVKESTRFASWDEMVKAAVDETFQIA